MPTRHRALSWATISTILCLFFTVGPALADGWHAAILQAPRRVSHRANRTKVAQIVRKFAPAQGTVSSDKPAASKAGKDSRQSRPAGKLEANLSKEEMTKAKLLCDEMIRVLKYMSSDNIFPREFPKFDMGSMPLVRSDAQHILRQLGPVASELILQRLLDHFTARRASRFDYTLRTSALYVPELIMLMVEMHQSHSISDGQISNLIKKLRRSGHDHAGPLADSLQQYLHKEVDPRPAVYLHAFKHSTFDEELRKNLAASAKRIIENAQEKQRPVPPFLLEILWKSPKLIQRALAKAIVECHPQELSIDTLRKLKPLLMEKEVQDWVNTKLLKEISREIDVVQALKTGDLVAQVLVFPQVPVNLRDQIKEQVLRKDIRVGYKNNRHRLPHVALLLKTKYHTYAHAVLQSAYQVAPISMSLRDLADAQGYYHQLIQDALDQRLNQANAKRKASYLKWSTTVAEDTSAPTHTRALAARFMLKVDPQKARPPIIALMDKAPLDLKIAFGNELSRATGQEFGPKKGMSLLEVFGAIQKWKAWDKQQRN